MKNDEHLLPLHVLAGKVPPHLRQRAPRRIFPRAILFLFFFLAFACLRVTRCSAQSTSDNTDTIRGMVINSVTSEPISRALVFSPDNRFATLTNSEGQFEFTLPKADPAPEGGSDSNSPVTGRQPGMSNRPYMLTARKPGFLPDPNNRGQNLQNEEALQDLTLALIPESLIAGTVTLPTAEAPDSIALQIFRRQVQDGRAHWVPAGNAQSTSDGQFRFADLPAGTYKLLTDELLDRDPLTAGPRNVDPLTNAPRGPLFGYPPVYYQSAPDFGSAAIIQLTAGQTQTVSLSLVKQPYYRVKVPVIDASVSDAQGVAVNVYAHGRKGPGFSLGYNNLHHAIEGMLPNGTYTIEASGWGANGVTGGQTITIKGAAIDGPGMTLVPNASIPVNVKEEFTSADNTGSTTRTTINGRNTVIKGPRRYLNVMLEPADDFRAGRGVSLRSPTRPGDEALVIEGAPAGSYWVRINSSRGYPASIRSGNRDLQQQPLVVGAGGAASPIEITMRDVTAEISGTVAGVTPPAEPPENANANVGAQGWTFYAPIGGPPAAHIYCIPLADSSGQFAEISVSPDGSFVSQGLAPGAYRLLAFDRAQPDLEYRNPEAMQAYDSKGPVVRLAGGQKEHVTLQLISTGNSGNEQ